MRVLLRKNLVETAAFWLGCVVLLATIFANLSGCGTRADRTGTKTPEKKAENADSNGTLETPDVRTAPPRIVSTVPSVTETLFALGLGESVVAVSDYCQYPPEVAKLPKIGSLFDFNVEAIVELAPDCVVVLEENDELRRRLHSLGVETLAVDASSLEGVLKSFEMLGKFGGAESAKRGAALRAETERRIAAIRQSVAGLERPRVLISIDRTPGIGKISDVFVAGQNPYFNSVLEIVGATNAAKSLAGAVPTVGPEGIVALNPEIVVDLATDGVYRDDAATKEKVAENRADWKSLGNDVDAVKNDNVYPILDVFATVPGPRTILFLENFADVVHPNRAREERRL